MYQLLEDLKSAQLESFIPSPESVEKAVNEYIDYGGSGCYRDDGEYGEDEFASEISETIFHTYSGKDVITMKEFMQIFDPDGDDHDDSSEILDILNTPLNEIMGITKPQLGLIPIDIVFTDAVFPEFLILMKDGTDTDKDNAKDTAIEDKILLASALAYLSLNYGISDEDKKQILRIMKSRDDFGTAIAIVREWLDVKKMDVAMYSYAGELKNVFGSETAAEFNQEYIEMFSGGIYIKPSHIHDLHDKMVRFKRKWNAKLQEHDEMKEGLFAETVKEPMYKKFTFTDWKFFAKPILSYKELVREGEALDHCVAEYADDVINNVCMIYSIRTCSAPNTPLYTAEIKRGTTLNDGREFRLTQCYGFGDTTEKDNALYDFIIKWCEKKGITIKCEI